MAFCSTLWGLIGVTYTVHLWLVGKRVVDFLLVLIKLFRQLSRLRRYERILVESVVFESKVGVFERKFQGESGSSTNDCLIQYRRVTDRQTDTHTHRHDDG